MLYRTHSHWKDTALLAFLTVGVAIIAVLCATGGLLERDEPDVSVGCGDLGAIPRQVEKLLGTRSWFVTVIGDGVPGASLVPDRPYNTQFSQGYDLFEGVKHAIEANRPGVGTDRVGILYVDDGGNPKCAGEIARFLVNEPGLLAVVGHSTTACTREALPYYSRRGIPVVIPAATNPELLKSSSSNAFRLPSNDAVQALVVADLVATKFQAKQAFVLWDATPEALQYSYYLKTTIQHVLEARKLPLIGDQVTTIQGSYPVSLRPLDYAYLFQRIASSNADIIVYAGYGSLAREFLFGLDLVFSNHPNVPRPRVILTDGCRIPEISGYGFDAYLTFPAPPLATFDAFRSFVAQAPTAPFQKASTTESYELFAYDAITLVLAAAQDLDNSGITLSRQSLLKHIGANGSSFDTAQPYAFENGENTLNRYYCYSIANGSVVFEYDERQIEQLEHAAGFR